MSAFDEYANKYKTARMERRNGVLQVTLHTDGQSLRWGFLPHGELPQAFHEIGADRENRVVILTGTGDEFSGPRASPGTSSFPTPPKRCGSDSSLKCCRPTGSWRAPGSSRRSWPEGPPCCCATRASSSPNICAGRCTTSSVTGSPWRAWRSLKSRKRREPERR